MPEFVYTSRAPYGNSVLPWVLNTRYGMPEKPFVLISKAFTRDECALARKLSDEDHGPKATVHLRNGEPGSELDLRTRDAHVRQVRNLSSIGLGRVWEFATREAHYQWELPADAMATNTGFQLLTYKVGGHYLEHSDNSMLANGKWEIKLRNRFISVVAFFSTHGEHFTGGALAFPRWKVDGEVVRYLPKAGDLVIFPSGPQSSHQVEPVTSGVRLSAATWSGRNLSSKGLPRERS